MSEHACPGGCGARVRHTRFACRSCWFRLPAELRELINGTYRTRDRMAAAHREAVRLAHSWYRNNPRSTG